jgi:hypothetical protein
MAKPNAMLQRDIDPEYEMFEAFLEQANAVLDSPDRFQKDPSTIKIGLESELALYNDQIEQKDLEAMRDAIIAETSEFSDLELGVSQIETRTKPFDVAGNNGWEGLNASYQADYRKLLTACRSHGASVMRIGSNPFLPVIKAPRTNKERYKLVPDYYNQNRPKQKDTMIGLGEKKIDIGDAAVVSLFQSFQVNLEASSLDDACDKMNRSLFIAPYLLSISGNARFLELTDSSLSDLRLISWEKSHDDRRLCIDTNLEDMRTVCWEKAFDLRCSQEAANKEYLRIGLPNRYFENMPDYFNYISAFPFILHAPERALGIAIGLSWFDARTKIIGDSAVVELRVLSTQPTIEEELTLTLLYIGRLAYSQNTKELIMPIGFVKENRLSAMLYGRKKPMWFLDETNELKKIPHDIGMGLEIEKAELGLEILGLRRHMDDETLDLMLRAGSPSARLADDLEKGKGHLTHARMKEAMEKTKMFIS